MSGKTDLFTSIIVAGVGIVMICLYQRIELLSWIVMLIGAMFAIPGIFSIIMGMRSKDKGGSGTMTLTGMGATALGAFMILMPQSFTGILVFLFAGLLIIGGIYHIVFVAYLSRPFVLPGYYYIIPVLMILAGIVLLTTSVRTLNHVVVLITGISFVAWSISTLMEWIATHPSKTSEGEETKQITE